MRTAKRISTEATGLVPAGPLFQRLAHNLRSAEVNETKPTRPSALAPRRAGVPGLV